VPEVADANPSTAFPEVLAFWKEPPFVSPLVAVALPLTAVPLVLPFQKAPPIVIPLFALCLMSIPLVPVVVCPLKGSTNPSFPGDHDEPFQLST